MSDFKMKNSSGIKKYLPAAGIIFIAVLLMIVWGKRTAHDQKVMSALTDFRKTISPDLSECMSQDYYITGVEILYYSGGKKLRNEITDLLIYVNPDYDLLPAKEQIRLAIEWADAATSYYDKRRDALKHSELFGGYGSAKYNGKTIYVEDYIPRLYADGLDLRSPDKEYHLYRYANSAAEHIFYAGDTEYTGADYPEAFGVSRRELEEYKEKTAREEAKKEAEKERKKRNQAPVYWYSGKGSGSSDFYGSEDYDNADDFADDWAEEFGEDFDDGWDEAYDYWMEQHGE